MDKIWESWPSQLDPTAVVSKAALVAITVLVAVIIHRICVKALLKFQDILTEAKLKSHKPSQAQRAQVGVGLLRQITTVCIGLFTVMIVLDELGVDIRPILAGAGVVGLAVGFGAQSLVKDFFNGLCLILENQITLGDWVTINGKSGTVEVLNFRITVLRDLEGTIHVFPNGTIDSLSNSTHGWSAAVLDLPVPRGQTFEQAAEVLLGIAKEMKEDSAWKDIVTGEVEVQGVQDINERGMIVRLRMVTAPGSHWSTGRNFRKRLAEYWTNQGYELPRPSQSLYVVQSDKGEKAG